MKTKILITILAGSLVISIVSAALLEAKPDEPGAGKPDKLKPVPATDVEMVKKISLRGPKGPPPWAGGGKGNKRGGAATGILGEPVAGSRYAVVVGISDYPGEDNDLEYSNADALDMHDALTTVYGFNESNVIMLTDGAATRSAILTAISDVGELATSSDDEVVFFFSGHGARGIAQDWDKEGVDEAIVAHDGVEELVPIWDGELQAAFEEFSTSRIIFVFDTCLAGGMKKDLELDGRVIAMATSEGGLAYEGSAWGNGEFTYYFVDEGISDGLANIHDYDGDGYTGQAWWVTVEEAYDYAKTNCALDKPTIGDNFDNDLLP